MNISLVKLGNEQCESCVSASQHRQQSGHIEEDDIDCSICRAHSVHMGLAKLSRSEYRCDGETIKPEHAILAVDLQKVCKMISSNI